MPPDAVCNTCPQISINLARKVKDLLHSADVHQVITMKITSLIFAGILLLLTACSSTVSISSDHQTDVNFDALKTYAWREANRFHTASLEYLNSDIIDGRIRGALDTGLSKRGYKAVEGQKPDFYITYSITTQDKADIRNYNTYNGVAPGFRYGRYHGGLHYGSVGLIQTHEAQVVHYKEGTLVVDVISASNDKLIWRASAEGKLHKNKTPQQRQERINEVVEGMLDRFPPKS